MCVIYKMYYVLEGIIQCRAFNLYCIYQQQLTNNNNNNNLGNPLYMLGSTQIVKRFDQNI